MCRTTSATAQNTRYANHPAPLWWVGGGVGEETGRGAANGVDRLMAGVRVALRVALRVARRVPSRRAVPCRAVWVVAPFCAGRMCILTPAVTTDP